jgi:hypothetical protein
MPIPPALLLALALDVLDPPTASQWALACPDGPGLQVDGQGVTRAISPPVQL